MRCFLEKGDNTYEKRDTTSSDLLKKRYIQIFSFETAEKRKMKRCCVRVRKTEKKGRLRRS